MNAVAVFPEKTIGIRSLCTRVRTRLRTSNRRGQSLVEMAVSLPLLLLILTGIFTFGIALNNYLMLTNAVQMGGEILAVSRGQTSDPCALAASYVYGAAPLLSQTAFSFTFVLNGTSYSGASCSSSSPFSGAAGNLVMGQPAQVTATYPCNLSVYGINYVPHCTLTAQIAEVVQ